jgi:hypothetical protein
MPELKAFITYIVNARPAIVALCQEYEKPVKELLSGSRPTLVLTQEDVERTIQYIAQKTNENGCISASWKQVNMDIKINSPDLVHCV